MTAVAICFFNHTGKSDTRLNGTENAFLKLADIERKFCEQKQELIKTFNEISENIRLLNDNELETILIHRYLLFNIIEQTAELLNYSPETVRRKTNKAIEKLCEKLLECGSLDMIE